MLFKLIVKIKFHVKNKFQLKCFRIFQEKIAIIHNKGTN